MLYFPKSAYFAFHLFTCILNPDELLIFSEAVANIAPSIKVYMISRPEELERAVNMYAPELVFVDINMYLLDGFGWLDLIRQKGYLFPVVMYSNSSQKKDIERAYKGGAMIYIVEPVNFDLLVRSLESLFALDIKEPWKVQQNYFSNTKCKVFES